MLPPVLVPGLHISLLNQPGDGPGLPPHPTQTLRLPEVRSMTSSALPLRYLMTVHVSSSGQTITTPQESKPAPHISLLNRPGDGPGLPPHPTQTLRLPEARAMTSSALPLRYLMTVHAPSSEQSRMLPPVLVPGLHIFLPNQQGDGPGLPPHPTQTLRLPEAQAMTYSAIP
jgi:hypothetical protein